MEFHIWDLERVNIKLNEKFLERINDLMNKIFGSKEKSYNKFFQRKEIPFNTFKNILKKSYMKNLFSLEYHLPLRS